MEFYFENANSLGITSGHENNFNTASSTFENAINKIRCTITDVKVIVPNKVVEVTFLGGDKQKAVCQEPDTFSLEMAISICITKHLLGGSGAYNKAIKDGVRTYNKKQKDEVVAKEEKKRIAMKRAKREEYLKRRKAKRREEQIEIQKEAYVRAMKEVGTDNENC